MGLLRRTYLSRKMPLIGAILKDLVTMNVWEVTGERRGEEFTKRREKNFVYKTLRAIAMEHEKKYSFDDVWYAVNILEKYGFIEKKVNQNRELIEVRATEHGELALKGDFYISYLKDYEYPKGEPIKIKWEIVIGILAIVVTVILFLWEHYWK